MSDHDLKNESVFRAAVQMAARKHQDYDIGQVEVSGASGLDALFTREANLVRPLKMASGRTKIASMSDLKPFMRLSSDTLIHKSDRELWSLKKEADGSFFVERLFDDNGDPLKG
jgi:hypothetical protein